MRNLALYIHPLHPESYTLVKILHEMRILGDVALVDAALPGPVSLFTHGVWVVPWLSYGRTPLAAHPMSIDEIVAIIESIHGSRKMDSLRAPVDAFVETVKSNAFTASMVFLHDSLYPVMDKKLVMAATRAVLTGIDPDQALEEIGSRERSLYRSIEDDALRTISLAFIRDAVVSGIDPLSLIDGNGVGALKLWLISKPSIGYSGLPHRIDPETLEEKASRITSYIAANIHGLVKKARKEYETITSDEEYWKILASRE